MENARNELGEGLHRALVAALTAAGWDSRELRGVDGADLEIKQGQETFIVELKVAPQPTRSLIEAMLASAVLRSETAARRRRARPLAIVGATSISPRTGERLERFAKKYLRPETAFGWIDARGRVSLHGSDSLEAVTAPTTSAAPKRWTAGRSTMFSDLGQWLMKVLLAPRLPEAMLRAPRELPTNVSHLARIAGVSQPRTHRVIREAREGGLVQDVGGFLSIVDAGRLLQRWRRAAAETGRPIPARWILRKRDSASALRKTIASAAKSEPPSDPTACLGLFEAAEALGLGHVRGVAPHVLLRRTSERALEELGLRRAQPGETPDVLVSKAAFPESTFRGAVNRDGVWGSDVLQTWLDTSYYPARGDEQADLIFRRVLSPQLEVESA